MYKQNPKQIVIHETDEEGKRLPRFTHKDLYFSFTSEESCSVVITLILPESQLLESTADSAQNSKPVQKCEKALRPDDCFPKDDPYYIEMLARQRFRR